MAGALRLDWMAELWVEEMLEVESRGAGKGVLEANKAIVRNASYAWS